MQMFFAVCGRIKLDESANELGVLTELRRLVNKELLHGAYRLVVFLPQDWLVDR